MIFRMNNCDILLRMLVNCDQNEFCNNLDLPLPGRWSFMRLNMDLNLDLIQLILCAGMRVANDVIFPN